MSYYYSDNGNPRGFLSNIPPVTKNLLIINILLDMVKQNILLV